VDADHIDVAVYRICSSDIVGVVLGRAELQVVLRETRAVTAPIDVDGLLSP